MERFKVVLQGELPVGTSMQTLLAKYGTPTFTLERDAKTLIYYYSWEGAELLIQRPEKVIAITVYVQNDTVIHVAPVVMEAGR